MSLNNWYMCYVHSVKWRLVKTVVSCVFLPVAFFIIIILEMTGWLVSWLTSTDIWAPLHSHLASLAPISPSRRPRSNGIKTCYRQIASAPTTTEHITLSICRHSRFHWQHLSYPSRLVVTSVVEISPCPSSACDSEAQLIWNMASVTISVYTDDAYHAKNTARRHKSFVASKLQCYRAQWSDPWWHGWSHFT